MVGGRPEVTDDPKAAMGTTRASTTDTPHAADADAGTDAGAGRDAQSTTDRPDRHGARDGVRRIWVRLRSGSAHDDHDAPTRAARPEGAAAGADTDDGAAGEVGGVGKPPKPDVSSLERALAVPPAGDTFAEDELLGLPEPVAHWFRSTIAPGTPLARSARLTMRGEIRLGDRWWPFQATETIAPRKGFVWPAAVRRVIRGSDHYLDGEGALDWRLLGRRVVAHADGPDVSRSAAGRGAAEGIWVPTALLPRFGVGWRAEDERHLVMTATMGGETIDQHLHVDGDGRVLRFHFDRWGDPDESGEWRRVPFGGDALAWATFDGVLVPSEARVGWWYGSPRFADGEFFRYEITDLELVR